MILIFQTYLLFTLAAKQPLFGTYAFSETRNIGEDTIGISWYYARLTGGRLHKEPKTARARCPGVGVESRRVPLLRVKPPERTEFEP